MVVEVRPKLIPVQDYASEVVAGMLSVKNKGRVGIVACNAALDDFNQPLFVDAAERVKEKKAADITVLITGPFIVVREDGSSGLLQLNQEKILTLVQAPILTLRTHDFIVEQESGARLYFEEVHAPFDLGLWGRRRWDLSELSNLEVQRQVEWVQGGIDDQIYEASDLITKNPEISRPMPLLITQKALDELVRICQDTRTLNYRDPQQLFNDPIVNSLLFK